MTEASTPTSSPQTSGERAHGPSGAINRRGPMREGERIQIGALRAQATPAEHDGKRDHPLGPHADPIGYLLDGSQRIYVAGDTDLFDAMELIGPVDYALLPIFGWGPGLGPGHMDPERAAEAVRRLQARIAIPIHWGTLWPIGRGEPPTEPAAEFAEHCARIAPDVEAAARALLALSGALSLAPKSGSTAMAF
mgnify:CR=1 FL=1